MIMMDQYMKETSQIHAPADLIRRTKQAVREEELRIERESGRTDSAAPVLECANAGAPGGWGGAQQQTVRRSGINTGKIYRWALPAAAAAMVLVLVNVVPAMVGNRAGKGLSGSPMNMTASDTASYDATPEAAMEAAEAEYDDAAMDFADQGDSDGAMVNQVTGIYESKNSGTDMYDGHNDSLYADERELEAAKPQEAAAAAEMDDVCGDEAVDADNGGSEGAIDGYSDAGLSIAEVEEIPDFVEDKNTKCILHRGYRFYVAKEWGNRWTAYVQAGETMCVITGDREGIEDQETFAEKAYELLAETAVDVE